MPTPTHSRLRRLAVASGALLMLSGCASTGDARAGNTGNTGGTDRADGSETVAGPIEELLQPKASTTKALEDAIAECMRDRGWDYTPATGGSAQASMVIGGSMDDPEFLRQYGYGISTQPPMEAWGVEDPSAGSQKDPNSAYLDSLSDEDRARYTDDLYNVVGDVRGGEGAVSGAVPEPAADDSCSAVAQRKVAKGHPEIGQEFSDRLMELMSGIEEDPKMVDANRRWSACMSRAGFSYDTPIDAQTDFQQRSAELLGLEQPDQGDGEGSPGAVMIGGVGEGAGPTTTLAPADQERLARIQDEERKVASADYRCRPDTVDAARLPLEEAVADKLRSEFPGLGGER